MSYRVTGTLRPGGKQQKEVFPTLEAAEACRDAWESIRVSNHAALRARATRLSQAELTAAEAATEMLKGTGFTLAEVTRLFLLNPLNKPTDKVTLAKAGLEFRAYLLAAVKAKTMSTSQEENLRLAQQGLTDFCGEKVFVHEVSGAQIEAWLRTKTGRDGDAIKRKTWNNVRGDLNRFFTWSMEKSRRWCTQNPVEDIYHFKKAELNRKEPERMDVSVCRDLMATVEREYPHWATFFAVTLFAAVRPDFWDGEMAELARGVGQKGAPAFFLNGVLRLPAAMTKDKRTRNTPISANLAAWLAKYPPTSATLNPNNYPEYTEIRKRFEIPFDGLRHTCISAFLSAGNPVSKAADQFGTSVRMIHDH